MKIEIRRPQYLAAKEPVAEAKESRLKKVAPKTPFFYRLLVVATYMLSALAIWYVYQRHNTHS